MTLLDNLRLQLGHFFSSYGVRPFFRNIYFSFAKIYQDQLPVREAWLRRSVTTRDFIPAWSDIDLTLIIDDKQVQAVKFPRDLLVKDVQIIPARFFKSWSMAGGLRNRQYKSWISLRQSCYQLSPSPWTQKEVLAFELGHEIYLLYFQLEKKIKEPESEWRTVAITKLMAEICRLQHYWDDPKGDWLLMERLYLYQDLEKSLDLFLKKFDQFCQTLFSHLHPHLQTFGFNQLIEHQYEKYSVLNLEIGPHKVQVFPDETLTTQDFAKTAGFFQCTETFLRLIKAVGVQEQTLLNELACDRSSYYFHYNLQRLATDLMAAYLIFPDNHRQLYFCFKNIHEFTLKVGNIEAPEWQIIDQNWTQLGQLPLKTHDLAHLTQAYLDRLFSLS